MSVGRPAAPEARAPRPATERDGRRAVHVLLVSGAPGSGKSTLGRALADWLGFDLVDLDEVGAEVTGRSLGVIGAPPEALDDPEVAPGLRAPRYAALASHAARLVAAGRGVVAVAPFTAERRDPGRHAAFVGEVMGGGAWATDAALLVYVKTPEEEIARRLAARGAERDRRKLADPALLRRSARPVPPVVDHLGVDGTAPLAEQVAAVVSRLLGSETPCSW